METEQIGDLPVGRMAAIGAAINGLVWLVDKFVPAEHHEKEWYRAVKTVLPVVIGALVGLVPDLFAADHWIDRMILGSMLGASASTTRNGVRRVSAHRQERRAARAAASVTPPTDPEVFGP